MYFTQKGQNLYVIQRKWAEQLQVDNVAKPKAVRLLGYDGPVKFTYKNNILQITAPQLNPNTIPCEYAWTYVLEGVN